MSIYKLSESVARQELEQFFYNSTLSDCDQRLIRQSNLADGNPDQFSAVDFARLPEKLQVKLFDEYKRFQNISSPNVRIMQTAQEEPSFFEIAGALVSGIVTAPFALFGASCGDSPPLRAIKDPEVCDGIDNNGDGQTDENLDQVCYTGPSNTRNVGECKEGKQKCVNGSYGPCEGEVVPTDEICDGKDNNCDGNTDEGVTNLCGTCSDDCERMTKTDGNKSHPSVAWTGKEFGIAWEQLVQGDRNFQDFKIHFARVDAYGKPVPNSDIEIASGRFPHLVWTGNEYGITWDYSNSQYFARLNPQGQKIGNDITVFNAYAIDDINFVGDIRGGASLAWNGNGFGIAVGATNNKIYFNNLDSMGNVIGAAQAVITGFDPLDNEDYGPALVWSGNNYGLAFVHLEIVGNSRMDAIYFLNLDRNGGAMNNPVRVGDGGANWDKPSLVWSQTFNQYGIAWIQDYSPGIGIHFRTISGDGLGIDSKIVDSDVINPSLAAGKRGYAIAWDDFRNGVWQTFFRKIASDGNLLGPELRKTQEGAWGENPMIVSGDNVYGVAWSGSRNVYANGEIYFSIIP